MQTSHTRGLSRAQSRGFISLGLILLLVLGLAVLGGAGWYVSQQNPVPVQPSVEIASTTQQTEQTGTKPAVGHPSLSVTNVKDGGVELTISYANLPLTTRSLMACEVTYGCTDFAVEFSPTPSSGTFVMTHGPGSAKSLGPGTYVVKAFNSANKLVATSGSFTIGSTKTPALQTYTREKCLLSAKNTYLTTLHTAAIICPSDSLGWPDPKCVQETSTGKTAFQTLYDADNACYSLPKANTSTAP